MDSDESQESPHFFKIIHSKIAHEGKLRIPPKFVTNYGNTFSSCVYLNVPNGNIWKVNLVVKENGDVWLENGWKEFADHYSVSLHHFLVFRYSKNSIFEVLIFDKSASEIQYPPPKSRKYVALNPKQERAVEEAESFRSENPFFMIKINKHLFKCNSCVPKSFRVEHFKNFKRGSRVKLVVAVRNKTWTIMYDTNYHTLNGGWCAFARETCLEVGDVCVFESDKKKGMNFFNLTIFRARKK